MTDPRCRSLARPVWLLWLCLSLVALLGWSAWHSAARDERQRRRRVEASLDQAMGQVAVAIQPAMVADRLFARVRREWRQTVASGAPVADLVGRWRRRAEMAVEIYPFDRHGNPVPLPPRFWHHRFILRQVWAWLQRPAVGQADADPPAARRWRAFFRAPFPFWRWRQTPGRTLTWRHPGGIGAAQWWPATTADAIGLMLVCRDLPTPGRSLDRVADRLARRGFEVAALSGSGGIHGLAPLSVGPADFTAWAAQRLASRGRAPGSEGRIWSGLAAADLWLIGSRPVIDEAGSGRLAAVSGGLTAVVRRAGWVGCLAIGLLIAVLVIRSRRVAGRAEGLRERQPGWSLRWRLPALFGAALLAPMVGFITNARWLLADRDTLVRNLCLEAAGRHLDDLDRGWLDEPRRLRRLGRNLRDDPRWLTDPGRMWRLVHRLLASGQIAEFDGRGLDGRRVPMPPVRSPTPARGSSGGSADGEAAPLSDDGDLRAVARADFDPVLQTMAQIAIARWLGARTHGRPPGRPPNPMLAAALTSPEWNLAHNLDRPDEVDLIDWGNARLMWYWDVIREARHPLAVMSVMQSQVAAVRSYLRRALGRRQVHERGAFRLHVWWTLPQEWYPAPVGPRTPLRRLAEQALLTGEPVVAEVGGRERRFLIRMLPARHLPSVVLAAMFPIDELSASVNGLRQQLQLGAIVGLLLTLLLGAVAADVLLVPVAAFTRGFEQLAAGRGLAPLRLPQRDEFGDLAAAFDAMQDARAEALRARLVQQTLIPRRSGRHAEWEFAFTHRTADELGGDYLDLVPIRDGRRLLMLGDVSGHGVSAALVMVMAKAVVRCVAASPGFGLGRLFERVSLVMHRALEGSRFLTAVAAVLEPGGGALELACAGHPPPLLLRRRPTVVEALDFGVLPLGILEHPGDIETRRVMLEPGDSLLVYTDGLTEARGIDRQLFGLERLRRLFATRPVRSAGAVLRRVRRALVGFGADLGRLDDDLTLAVARFDPRPTAADEVTGPGRAVSGGGDD